MIFDSLKEYREMKPGLSRIKKFLKENGDPQKSFKCVHIAGTNGKGSTARLIADILKENGISAGLYTSPHLTVITERIKTDGKDISAKKFKELSGKYFKAAKKHGLTYFEYLTALAFIYFAEKKVKIAILETGLGGRLDATNIVGNPLVCIITSIAQDHKEILGGSVKEIAFEKAGIIKKNARVVCGRLPEAAAEIIKAKAEPFVFNKDFKALNIKYDTQNKEQIFDYRGLALNIKGIRLSLLGSHQIINAAVAVCCAELLALKGFALSPGAVKRALRNVSWPARFDIRKVNLKNKKFTLIIDGSHNEQAIDALTGALRRYGFGKTDLIFGIMKEKEYKKIVKKMVPCADNVILPDFGNPRAVKICDLEKEFLKYKPGKKIFKAASVKEALGKLKNGAVAAVAGSFYLAGEVLKNINKD